MDNPMLSIELDKESGRMNFKFPQDPLLASGMLAFLNEYVKRNVIAKQFTSSIASPANGGLPPLATGDPRTWSR